MIRLALSAALAVIATPALADFESRRSDDNVTTVMDRLVEAVEGAGATVFARVDHAEGARSVGMDLPGAQLLIFGNPQLGTPAMQDDIRAGLVLPLRVLVHEGEDGGSVIVYEEVEEMFDEMSIDDDAEYVERMEGALERLTEAAADD